MAIEKPSSKPKKIVSISKKENPVATGMQALDKVAENSEYLKRITALKKEIEKAYARAKLWPPIEWGKHPNLRSFYECVRDGFTQFSKLDATGGWCYLKNPSTNEERAFMLVVASNAYKDSNDDCEDIIADIKKNEEAEGEPDEDVSEEEEKDVRDSEAYEKSQAEPRIDASFRPSKEFKQLVAEWGDGKWKEKQENSESLYSAQIVLIGEMRKVQKDHDPDDMGWVANVIVNRFAKDIKIPEEDWDALSYKMARVYNKITQRKMDELEAKRQK